MRNELERELIRLDKKRLNIRKKYKDKLKQHTKNNFSTY